MSDAVGEIVTVVVDGHALQGWQGVHVTRSAKAAAISFSLQASNPAWSAEARALRRGKVVEVFASPDAEMGSFSPAGSDLLCTGYVDDYEVESAPGQHEVGIAGRSKAGDAIDCPPVKHKTGLEENKTLLEAAKAFDEWGIGFTADVPLKKLPAFQVIPGEPLFTALEREARHIGVLLPGQPDGSVKITRAGTKRHAGALVEGDAPVKRMKLNVSMEAKRSEVRVRGQRALGTGKDNLRQEKTKEDGTVGRHRPLIVHHEGDDVDAELERRAEWEMLRRSGSGISLVVKVASWRDAAGEIWEPGKLVAVVMASEEVDQDLAISTVTLNQVVGDGEGAGTWADVTLVEPQTLGGKKGSKGSGGGGGAGGGSDASDFDVGEEIGPLDDGPGGTLE